MPRKNQPGCPCCKPDCCITILTYWCGKNCFVSSTPITVTIRKNNASGPIIETGTASTKDGSFVWCPPESGTYYAEAAAHGYLNDGKTFTVNVTKCTPKTVLTPLYPNELTITDSATGQSSLVFPYGSTLAGGPGNKFLYIGQSTPWSYPGSCGCAGSSVTFYYFMELCSVGGNPQPSLLIQAGTYPVPNPPFACPGDPWDPIHSTQTQANLPNGSGPGLTPPGTCYPVNLSGTNKVLGGSGFGIIYGNCNPATFTYVTYTCTQ